MQGQESDFQRIARVLKSNGTDGEVLLGFRDLDPEDLSVTEPVFIEFDGQPVPFFIESLKPKGSGKAFARLTGLKNLKDAEEIVGKDISVKKGSINNQQEEDSLSIDNLEGWTILDPDGDIIGTVTGFEDIPGNPCLYVDTSNGQAGHGKTPVNTGNGQTMIPVHEDFILSIDEASRNLVMRLPEGLI